ncbi:EamA family transporter [Candidatus Woesebacteria bacterium]|nr:EamA family transporter [Candidatus Woesebacteria bacterium]
MNWIVASILMLVSSVGLYLFVRKSNTLKTPQQLNNLAMFLVPVVVYLIMTVGTPTDFVLEPFEYLLIIIQAIFFSYLGNVFSLKGIEYAPNPGYSLTISRSYVVFTAIASIYLFDSPLTTKSVIAIVCIIIFAALIAIDKDRDKLGSNAAWLPYTIGAFFCAGFSALSSKYLLNVGVPILTRLLYSMLLVTILIVGEIVVKKVNLKNTSKPQLLTLLMIGIFGASFNYFMQVAFDLAPNVGYVNATNAASISLLTIMSYLVFKDELSIKKMIGIVGVTTGLILLFV